MIARRASWLWGKNGCRDWSRGAILIEVLIALAILGLVSTTFIGAMYTSLQSSRIADERSISLTLAKSQIEYARDQGYSANDWAYTVNTSGSSYSAKPSWWDEAPVPALDSAYNDYSVTVTGIADVDLDGAGGPDDGIRTITATVRHAGNVVFTLENYEVDR